MTLDIIKYSYGNKNKWIGPFCAVLSLPVAWYLYHAGADGKPFNFKDIHVEAPNASYIYWALSAAMIFVFLVGMLKIFDLFSKDGERFIEISDRDITLPNLITRGRSIYSFGDIKEINTLNIANKRYISFKTRYGSAFIGQKFFKDPADFEALRDLLSFKTGKVLR